jgi:hypothetical protein
MRGTSNKTCVPVSQRHERTQQHTSRMQLWYRTHRWVSVWTLLWSTLPVPTHAAGAVPNKYNLLAAPTSRAKTTMGDIEGVARVGERGAVSELRARVQTVQR